MTDELTPREVARELGVTVRTVQRWIAAGRLPATRVGYLVYPLALLVLAQAMRDNRERRGGEVERDVAARG